MTSQPERPRSAKASSWPHRRRALPVMPVPPAMAAVAARAWVAVVALAGMLAMPGSMAALSAPAAVAPPGTVARPAQYALIVNADDSFTHNYNVSLALTSLAQLGYAPRNTLVLAPGAPQAPAPAAGFHLPATEGDLRQALAELHARMRPGDLLLVYLTGHGYRMFGRTSLALQGGSITDHELVRRLGELPFGKLILIADQCYSGGFVKAAVALGRDVVAVSSADDHHEARCEPFIRPLWLAAVAAASDTRGNGFVSVEEAFAVAAAGLRRSGAGDHGDTPQIAASGSCAGRENGFSAAAAPDSAPLAAAAAPRPATAAPAADLATTRSARQATTENAGSAENPGNAGNAGNKL